MIEGDFNTQGSLLDRSSRTHINRERLELSDILNQKNQIDIYRRFHPNTKEYISLNLMKLSPKLCICLDTKQVSSDTVKLK